MALHTFNPGDTAGVSAGLNSNFLYLLGLIQAAVTQVNVPGLASGSSSAIALSRLNWAGQAQSAAFSAANGVGFTLSAFGSTGTATGLADGGALAAFQSSGVGAAASASSAAGIGSTTTIVVSAGVGAATGTSTTDGVTQANRALVGAASGTSTAVAQSLRSIAAIGVASSVSTANGVSSTSSQVESADGTFVTDTPATVFASPTPGTAGTPPYNQFSLTPAYPNRVFNSANAGPPVTGTPGTWPTQWGASVQAGLTQTIVGFGTDNSTGTALPYIDVQLSGTTTATTNSGHIYLGCLGALAPGNGYPSGSVSNTIGMPVLGTTTYNASFYWGLVGGTQTNLTLSQLNHDQWNNTTYVTTTGGSLSLTNTLTRVNSTVTTAATTNNVVIYIVPGFNTVVGSAVNITIRIAGVQFTKTAAPVPFVSTTTAVPLVQPGQVVFNTVIDTATSNIAEIYYHLHNVYLQNTSGGWTRWNAPGSYTVVTNPLPVAPIRESANLASVTTVGPAIYGSLTNGQAAPANATYPGGLNSFALSANPGNIIYNGVLDTAFSGNVVQLAYVGHVAYQLNSTGNWYSWPGSLTYWTDSANPFPVARTLGMNWIENQNTGQTFVVSGTVAGNALVPTLQYQDNAGAWQALPSSVNVTNSTWSFVHPPISTVSASFTVSVRDAVTTTILATSNAFQVATVGVVTITGVSLSNTSFTGGQPAGTNVGVINVAVSGGSFAGTLSLSGADASKFVISGFNLNTAAVVGSGTYSVVITATMAGAVGSPFSTTTQTLIATAESPSGTIVTTVGPVILGSATPGVAGAQESWAMVLATAPATNNQITLNGVLQTSSNQVSQIAYYNHTFYQLNGVTNQWYVFTGAFTTPGQAQFTQSNSPVPAITSIALSSTQMTLVAQQTGPALVPVGTFTPSITIAATGFGTMTVALSGTDAAKFAINGTFAGNNLTLSNVVAIPAGTYNISITATET